VSEVKSAQITISEHWPEHVYHKTVGKAPRWDAELGVVCACAVVLGWPDPEHKETLSQYAQRVAREQVDAASAPGRVKGAFGTYARPVEDVQLPARGDDTDPVAEGPAHHDDDPGPDEPDDGVDWGEPPADEPEPEVLVIEDGDSEDVGTAPFPADAVPDERGNMISDGKSYGQPSGPVDFGKLADEAQAELVPWDGSEPRPERWQDSDGIGWVPPESATPQEIADSGLYPVPAGEVTRSEQEYAVETTSKPFGLFDDKPSNEGIPTEEIGRDLVPYAGTPIMPTEAEVLDPLVGRLAPLDPTLPYTPADVELKIVEILRQLENSELFLRQQLARLHQATHNYNMRYNLAYKTSDGRSDGQRKADAVLATERESYEMTEAEMLVRALRDSQHNLRSQLSGFQSVARSLAVSMVNSLDGRERPPLPPEPPRYP
jgi:hypothetical protein